MPEMHLGSQDLHVVLVDHSLKIKKDLKKSKETGDLRYIYQKELDEACFQHFMVSGDFKDLNRWTAADKVLHDKAFKITKNPKYDGYQGGIASMVHNFFDKKTSGGAIKKIMQN